MRVEPPLNKGDVVECHVAIFLAGAAVIAIYVFVIIEMHIIIVDIVIIDVIIADAIINIVTNRTIAS